MTGPSTAREATVERLYSLLPRMYRVHDEVGGRQLRALLEVIAEQIDVVEESLDQLYDDQFIETSAEWVVPYLGDLIGYRPLAGTAARIATPRAEVANTIAYRRRKGTAAMLEQLAYDVTGWKARAVEFFERLAVTQYMNHPRPGRGGPAELRYPDALQWSAPHVSAGAFDELAHTADVRRVGTGAGRYNVHNVGLFLWRTNAVELTGVPLVADAGSRQRFRFHQLGIDQPLFGKPSTEEEITHIAEPTDVPVPLSRRWVRAQLETYYGEGRSLFVAGAPADIRICDLSDVNGDWANAPGSGSGAVAIDPVLGRVYFPDPVADDVTPVGTFHYGAALDIGGGGYGRSVSMTGGQVHPCSGGTGLTTALAEVAGGGTVEIVDNWRYRLDGTATPTIAAAAGATVVVRAADRRRPLLAASAPIVLAPGPDATIVLDGLIISGAPLVLEAGPGDERGGTVVLRHCTLVPGLTRTPDNRPGSPAAASLVVNHHAARVEIDRCVLGPVVAVEGATVSMRDSVVDAGGESLIAYAGDAAGAKPGGTLKLDEVNVIGRVQATEAEISNSILMAGPAPAPDEWPAPVWVRRRQTGCVRFSYLPDDSLTPQRYRCPSAATGVRPHFTSLRFGDPGYAQLRPETPDAIRRGADNDSEMGAGNHLYAPQREANLRLRLDEYLRFGLEAGIFYAT